MVDPYRDPFDRIAMPKPEHQPTEVERLTALALEKGLPEIANKLAEQANALETAKNQCTALRAQLTSTLDELEGTHGLLRKAVKELNEMDARATERPAGG